MRTELPTSQLTQEGVYGNTASYKAAPNANQVAAGVVPLDTLPAQWWNWLWNSVGKDTDAWRSELVAMRSEILNVLKAANGSEAAFDDSVTQLSAAISKLVTRIATATVAGAIKSSSDIKSVSVDGDTGVATVNALADWGTTVTVKERLDAQDTAIQDAIDAQDTVIQDAIDEQDGKIQDAIDGIDGQIESRSRVFTCAVTFTSVTSASATSSVSNYTPQAGDVFIVNSVTGNYVYTGSSFTLSAGGKSITVSVSAISDAGVPSNCVLGANVVLTSATAAKLEANGYLGTAVAKDWGTAAVGTSLAAARADHVHPTHIHKVTADVASPIVGDIYYNPSTTPYRFGFYQYIANCAYTYTSSSFSMPGLMKVESATAASTATKTATSCSGCIAIGSGLVLLSLTYTNTAASPKLTISSNTYAIYQPGRKAITSTTAGILAAGVNLLMIVNSTSAVVVLSASGNAYFGGTDLYLGE